MRRDANGLSYRFSYTGGGYQVWVACNPLQGRGPSMAVLGPLCWCDVALGQGVLVLSRPAPRRSIIVLQYIVPLPQTGHADVLVPVVLVWV